MSYDKDIVQWEIYVMGSERLIPLQIDLHYLFCHDAPEGQIDKAQRHLTSDVALTPYIAELEHHGDAGHRAVREEVAAEVEQMAADGRRIFRKGAVINKKLDPVDEYR